MNLCLFSLKLWVDDRAHCFENKNFYLKEHIWSNPLFWHFHAFPLKRQTNAKRQYINLQSREKPLFVRLTINLKLKYCLHLQYFIVRKIITYSSSSSSNRKKIYWNTLRRRLWKRLKIFMILTAIKFLYRTQLIALWILIKKLLITEQKAFC